MVQEPLSDRDHRVLGPSLNLFSFNDYSPGIAFWAPKGMYIYNKLMQLVRDEYEKRGFEEVRAPLIFNSDLWKKSGHYEHFKPNMFFLESEGKEFGLKPMNCPGHCIMVSQKIRSYRELPIRYAEMSPLHRNEKSGSLEGLKRVRSFSQDDAHIFCRPDQVSGEVEANIEFLKDIYKKLGFEFNVELSLRPANSIGSDEIWKLAEDSLRAALKASNLSYKENPGDGAFYGPKIDFHIKDALGRSWQCGTVQLDFNLPSKDRFNLLYRDQDNQLVHPVMIHRAIFGSFERMIACLVEHWNGDFPLWLAPEQMRIIPVAEKHQAYAEEIKAKFKGNRIFIDKEEGYIGPRIKSAIQEKIPYIAVIGDKEIDSKLVSLRKRGEAKSENIDLLALERLLKEENR